MNFIVNCDTYDTVKCIYPSPNLNYAVSSVHYEYTYANNVLKNNIRD